MYPSSNQIDNATEKENPDLISQIKNLRIDHRSTDVDSLGTDVDKYVLPVEEYEKEENVSFNSGEDEETRRVIQEMQEWDHTIRHQYFEQYPSDSNLRTNKLSMDVNEKIIISDEMMKDVENSSDEILDDDEEEYVYIEDRECMTDYDFCD